MPRSSPAEPPDRVTAPPAGTAEPIARLVAARIGLSLREPFLASALMRLPFREVRGGWCATMATDGYHVFYDPDWVATLTPAQIDGVLAHEVLHVVLGHADRRGDRDPERWNMAADYAINDMLRGLRFELPAGGLVESRFERLSAERIYDLLTWDTRQCAWLAPQHGTWPRATLTGRPMRDLLAPDDPRCAARRDADMPDAEGRRMLRRQLAVEVGARLGALGAGRFASEIVPATERRLDWALLLRQWLGDRVRSDWRTFPFARRHLHRGLYLPSVGVEMPGHVVFAIDTSGSMTDADLAKAFGEAQALREVFPCRMSILQCDAAIHGITAFEAGDDARLPARIAAKGRGATDFRPVFDWIAAQDEPAAGVVFVTDGFGRFPTAPPAVDVIWLVTRDHAPAADFPFGRVVAVG